MLNILGGIKMENLMKKFFRSSIITSIVLIVLGLLLIFQSEITILSISYILGGILIALGVLAIIKFIRNTNTLLKSELDIVYGVVTIILGILIIKNPEAIASIIPIILGISIIISSATKLQYACELKANKNSLWKTTMIISIISTLCGIILLFNPFKGAVMFTKIIGIFIVIYAILDIISTTTIKKNVTIIHNAIDRNIADAEVLNEEETDGTTNENIKQKNKKKHKNGD